MSDKEYKEILKLAGKLAMSAKLVTLADAKNLSKRIEDMNNDLIAYDSAIYNVQDSKRIVWVGALQDYYSDNNIYIPCKCEKGDLYTGKGALPYFYTIDECIDWCNNKNKK